MAAVMRYAFKQEEQDRPTLDECIKCTQMLDLKKPLKESAKVYAKKKFGKDDWRPIADFGIQHRTAQEMVKACQSARKLDPLSASKNDPLGAHGYLARCGVAPLQRSRIGPAWVSVILGS